jgi:predicted GNAT superfamily acetyltransferase
MLPHTRDFPAPPPAVGAPSNTDPESAGIRHLETLDEFQSCVDLQINVWGAEFTDVVPASILQVASHIGGLILGAFADDALIGFVFGLTGVKGDEVVHWSHMLGVRAEAREMGIGRRLKEAQRAELARRGIAREFWTFDPLQARNAHLNVNRLGVRVIDYAVNMYGSTGSPLHLGIATDRFIVELDTTKAPRPTPVVMKASPVQLELPIFTPSPRVGDVIADDDRPSSALIEIPWDVQNGNGLSADEMLSWRMATRTYFQWAFLHGYRVSALHRDREAQRAFYVIDRNGDV